MAEYTVNYMQNGDAWDVVAKAGKTELTISTGSEVAAFLTVQGFKRVLDAAKAGKDEKDRAAAIEQRLAALADGKVGRQTGGMTLEEFQDLLDNSTLADLPEIESAIKSLRKKDGDAAALAFAEWVRDNAS